MSELGRAISKLRRVSYWEGYMAAVNQAQQAMYAGDIYAWLIKVTSGEIVEGELVLPEDAALDLQTSDGPGGQASRA